MNKIILIVFTIVNLMGNETKLKPYQLVNSNIDKYKNMSTSKDAQGIPLLNFNGQKIYYPITISQVALHFYAHYYETKNENSKNEFLKYAQWMKDNFQDNGTWGGWYCHDPLHGSAYHLKDVWMSAMSQGFGLSVMVEAFELTQDNTYLTLAKKALNSFEVSVADDGIQSSWGTTMWYDEYPTTPEKHVLNGFIFSLAGLYNYYTYTKSLKAKKLFDDGVNSLHEHLASYDAGFNSFYSSSVNPTIHSIASITGGQYHDLHIAQLLWLYKVTGDIFFYKFAHKFLQYDMGEVEQYGVPHKYKDIKASHTINSKTHGADNLHDSIWSYGSQYWSTYKFPTELEVEFNGKVDNLNEFVLVTTGSTLPASEFEFYIFKKEKWVQVKFKQLDEQLYTERHFKANVLRYKLDGDYSNIKKIKIVFLKHNQKTLALREINFHYDMSKELNTLLDTLNYHK